MAMASMASMNRSLLPLILVVIIGLQFFDVGMATDFAFCPRTLGRPTCPDLSTYDAFDVLTYGGRWYEIGSSANFKNLQEAGGICVVANYTLLEAPEPGKGGVVGVYNSIYSIGAANHNGSQVLISLTSGSVCSDAFLICAQVDGLHSPLSDAVGIIVNTSVKIGISNPALTLSLGAASIKIGASIAKINFDLDNLSKSVHEIQKINAQLGQGQGNGTSNVADILAAASEANTTVNSIADEVQTIAEQRAVVEDAASKLATKKGNEIAILASSQLNQSATIIKSAEDTISAKVIKIKDSISRVAGVSNVFLIPGVGEEGYSGIVGTAVQNASFAGKLQVTFPGFPPGNYWVLAVENSPNGDGYAATLVYGCDQSEGGIEETLFVLSRTPTLSQDVVDRLLFKAFALGVSMGCSTPFIATVQDSARCGNPPSSSPPFP